MVTQFVFVIFRVPISSSSAFSSHFACSLILGEQTGRPVSETRRACGWCLSCSTDVWNGSACRSSLQVDSFVVPTVSPHEQSLRFWKYLVGIKSRYYHTTQHVQNSGWLHFMCTHKKSATWTHISFGMLFAFRTSTNQISETLTYIRHSFHCGFTWNTL